jgi:hypothetical protein
MSDLGHWGDPLGMPRSVNAPGVLAYEVVTVNADGTVDLRNTRSRASRGRVPGLSGWTPTKGDIVLAVDLGGDPQDPAVIAVQRASVPFGS